MKSKILLRPGQITFPMKEGNGYSVRDDLSIWNEGQVESFSVEIESNCKN